MSEVKDSNYFKQEMIALIEEKVFDLHEAVESGLMEKAETFEDVFVERFAEDADKLTNFNFEYTTTLNDKIIIKIVDKDITIAINEKLS